RGSIAQQDHPKIRSVCRARGPKTVGPIGVAGSIGMGGPTSSLDARGTAPGRKTRGISLEPGGIATTRGARVGADPGSSNVGEDRHDCLFSIVASFHSYRIDFVLASPSVLSVVRRWLSRAGEPHSEVARHSRRAGGAPERQHLPGTKDLRTRDDSAAARL